MVDPQLLVTFRRPILATVAYIVLYYLFLIWGLKVKFSVLKEVRQRDKSKDQVDTTNQAPTQVQSERRKLNFHPSNHPLVKEHPLYIRSERTQLNMLEQMPPFLTGLWLYAIFCDPEFAGLLGFLYTVLRAGYPFVYASMALPVVTFSNYAIIAYLFINVLVSVL